MNALKKLFQGSTEVNTVSARMNQFDVGPAANSGIAVGVGVGALAFGNSAMAAVPVAVTTAFTDITTDVGTVGGLLLVAALAILGILYIKRTMTK